MRRLLILSFLLSFFVLAAQDKAIDGLRNKLAQSLSPSDRYNLLDSLYDHFDKINQDTCERIALEKLGLARSLGNTGWIIESLLDLASARSFLGLYDEALASAVEADELAEHTAGTLYGKWNTLNMLGSLYTDKGDYEKSLEYHIKAMKYAEKKQDEFEIGSSQNNIGNVYRVMGTYDRALENYRSAGRYFSRLKKNVQLAGVYNNIGVIRNAQGQKDTSLWYYEKAYQLYEGSNDVYGMATSLSNIGGVYYDKGDFRKVLDCDQRSLALYERISNRTGMVVTLNNMAGDYKSLGDYEKAIELSTKSLQMAREFSDLEDVQLAYKSLADIYSEKKDFERAYLYSELAQGIKDTIASEASKKNLIEMQEKYETAKKEKEIEVLNARNDRNKIAVYSSITGIVLLLVLALLLYNRNRVKQRANRLLELQNQEIQQQKQIIEEKNKDITDSIRYAQRIQNAILPSPAHIRALLPQSFVFFRPKDIVSGDFYWVERWGNQVLFAAVDCTGHGVPGALMSVVGYNLLNQALNEHGLSRPNLVLNELNKGISRMMRERSDDAVKDGMDLALCAFDQDRMVLEYAGAFNSLYHIRRGVLTEINADKIAIGSYRKDDLKSYTHHELKMEKGDTVYVFTDGYADQFGGSKGKKFKYKPFQEMLLNIQELSMEEQLRTISDRFSSWKGNLEQVDDVLVMGIRI